jgi:hypothetical protein
MNATPDATYVPAGTRVLNTTDGEPGTILNGSATDGQGRWCEYEVETAYGIENWDREQFVLFSELEEDTGGS